MLPSHLWLPRGSFGVSDNGKLLRFLHLPTGNIVLKSFFLVILAITLALPFAPAARAQDPGLFELSYLASTDPEAR